MNATIQSHLSKIPATSLFYGGNILFAVGLSVSKPLISIGQMMILFAALIFWAQQQTLRLKVSKGYIGAIALLWILPAISLLYTENQSLGIADLRIKLPFLFIPFAYAVMPSLSEMQKWRIAFLFALSQLVIAAISWASYFVVYENSMQKILEHQDKNGTIDIISHVHHIYFGTFLAFGALWAGYYALQSHFSTTQRRIMAILCIMNAIFVHLFTSRTGFVVFYTGLLLFVAYYIYQKRQFIVGGLLLLSIFALPLALYYFLPSFHNRITLTFWDLNEYLYFHHLCDCSMAKRIFAWEQTLAIIRAHPWIGVGSGDMQSVLHAYSLQALPQKTLIWGMDETRLLESPHNQYLEQFAVTGIAGGFALFFAWGYPYVFMRKQLTLPYLLFSISFALAMLTESMLERQWGVAFFVGMAFLLLKEETKNLP